MIVFLQLTTAGVDSGPFDLYSNLDAYSEPFEENVSRASLIAGYSTDVPDYATVVRITSKEDCISSVDITLRDVECDLEGYTGEITTSTSSTTTSTTTAPPTLRASIDISPSPQCDGSVLVTVRPDVNAYVNITSSFAPGGGAVYLAGLPIEAGVTNIYSNLSDNVVNAGITKKYRFGISAYRYTSGIGNIYTSNIYIAVRDAVDDSLLADYVFYRTHIDQQC